MYSKYMLTFVAFLVLMLGVSPEALAAPQDRLPDIDKLARMLHFLVLVLGAGIGSVALLVLHGAWLPETARRGSHLLRNRPLYCCVVGILLVLVLGGLVAVSANVPNPLQGILALIAIVPATLLAIRGGTMIAYDLGDRMLASLNSRFIGSVTASVLTGGLAIALVGLVPVVGQIVQVLLLIIAGGAAVGSRDSRGKSRHHDANEPE